jgi:hypothetical protein
VWLFLHLKQPQQTLCLVTSKTQFNFGGTMIIHVLHVILTKQLLAAFQISVFTFIGQFTCTVHVSGHLYVKSII